MSLDPKSVEVLTRALPKDKIHTRPGKAGMEFAFITPDFVIETLNEAFGSEWGTKIVFQEVYDNVVVVGLQLYVPTTDGKYVAKEQFGSCEITRGLDTGSAFKGAASDALKKCATLFGVGLELYKDESEAPAATAPAFRPPSPRPSAPPTPPAPPRPQASKPVAPPAKPTTSPLPPKPVAPPAPPANPFSGSAAPVNVPRPTSPSPAPVAPPRANPFQTGKAVGSSPNSTQLSAMINLANRKGLTPSALISLAGVVDETGNPVQSFEDLTHAQAIQVIRAAQG